MYNKLEKRQYIQNWNKNNKISTRKNFRELRTPEDWLAFNCAFIHSCGFVNLKKEPYHKKGRIHFVNKNGIDKTFQEGEAISCPKFIHAKYCDNLFHCKKLADGTHYHLEEVYTNLYETQLVIARWDQTGYFLMGNISEISDHDHANISFENGREQNNLRFKYIVPVPKQYQYIKVGDYVMANILNENDQDCWIPGKVLHVWFYTGKDGFDRLAYSVQYYNNYEGLNEQEQVIKINKKRYDWYKDYLIDLIKNPYDRKDDDNRYVKSDEIKAIDYEDFEEELIIFGKQYEKLKFDYRPILQAENNFKETFDSKHLTEDLLVLRNHQRLLKVGQRVVAKWPGDGYYYDCKVINCIGNNRYQLENILKDFKYVYREDIMEMQDDKSNDFYQIGDTVIAKHPKYKFAYAPGEVIRYHNNPRKLMIRYYDYSEGFPDKQDVYSVKRSKFEQDINYILGLELKWIGIDIYGVNNNTKRFERGKIINRIHLNRQFSIVWSDGKESIQNAYNLFMARSKSNQVN